MFIVTIINSIVGKEGNIGYRFNFIQEEISKAGYDSITLARGSVCSKKNTFTLGLIAYFPRFLHYLRRHYLHTVNTRKFDIFIF